MATRIAIANTTVSGASTNLKKAEYSNLSMAVNSTNYTDVSTAQVTPGFNVTNGVSLQGAFIWFRKLSTTNDTVTVSLEEGNLSSGSTIWTQKATMTFSSNTLSGSWGGRYCTFGTPYTASTVQYRIKVSCTTANRMAWMRSATATDFFAALFGNGDDTTGYVSGDTWIIANGITLTVDQAITLAPQFTRSIVVGDAATLYVPNPSASFKIDLGLGSISKGNGSFIRFGDSGTPITAANQVEILQAQTDSFNNFIPYFEEMWNIFDGGAQTGNVQIFGQKPTAAFATVAANAAAAQAVVNVGTVPGSWTNGDVIRIIGKDTLTVDTVTYTISSMTGSTVTLNAVLDIKTLIGAVLINITEFNRTCGVKFSATTSHGSSLFSTSAQGTGKIDYYDIQGVYLNNVCMATPDTKSSPTKASNIDTVLMNVSYNLAQCPINSTGGTLHTINNFFAVNGTAAGNGVAITSNKAIISNMFVYGLGGSVNTITFNGNNFTITNIVAGSNSSMLWTGYGHLTTNAYLIGSNLNLGASASQFVNVQQGRWNTQGMTVGNAVNCTFANSSFGVIGANTSSDITFTTDTLSQLTMTDCTLGAGGVNTSYRNTIRGSYLRFVNYGAVVADYRSWYTNGTFVSSTNDIVQSSNNGTTALNDVYNLSSGTLAGTPVNFLITGTIANANYYGGTFTLPSITIAYDASSSVTTSLSASTSAQAKTLTFTPATSNKPLSVTLATKSNGANPDVTWTGAKFVIREYGKVFATVTPAISQTTDAYVATLSTQATNPFITQTTAATVAAYTGITINHSTQTVTISSNHTEQEIYDYSQWDLTQSANLGTAEWLTTTDGANYTSAYNIVVNTGVTITGTSGHNFNLGAKTLTLTGTAALSGLTITDSTGTVLSVTFSGLVAGSLYEIHKTSGGAVIGSGTAAGTSVTFNYKATASTPYTYVIRLFGYLEVTGTGTIATANTSIPVSQTADPNTASYPAGVATDFTINASTGVIAHASGTTVYTVRNLYNYQMDYMANSARMQNSLKMSAQTPFDFTLINSATISDADHNYLKSGSLTEASGNTLWSNVYTVGTIASGSIYIYQNGSKITSWWSTGNIDVLLKVKTGGSLIDSGDVTLFTRTYSYLYDHFKTNLANGGRNAVSVTNSSDASNQTASATVGAYGVTITAGAVSKDIGDGLGSQPYSISINGNGKTANQIYEYLKYATRETSSGEAYTRANSSYTEVKTSPYGTFAGGTLFLARGVWLENVATADALNYITQDNNAVTHQVPSPPVAVTTPNLIDGTRIQIYNLTTSNEIDNSIKSGTYSVPITLGVEAALGDVIRLRATYSVGGVTKKEIQSLAAMTSAGVTFIDTQVDWDEVNAWGLDGSTITEFTADYPNLQADADDADGVTTKTRLGAWFAYNNTTASGIQYFFGGMEVPASNVIKFITSVFDFHLVNISTLGLLFTDSSIRMYRDDGTTLLAVGAGSIDMDYSGVPDVVETGVSGLTPTESTKLLSIPTDPLTLKKFVGLQR